MIDINKIYSSMIENNQLDEGINDTAIFKAVFLAGGPGSGKSFIGTEKKGKSPTVGADPKQFMGGGQLGLINLGLRVVNPDPAYEKLLKTAGLDPKSSDDIWSDKGQEIRVKASELTAKQKAHYVNERLGIIIDGTGKDVNKIIGQKKLLDDAGYETAMIYVNTNLETAIARDAKRDRTLGAKAVTKMWDAVQKNVKKYKSIFGSSMYIIDNSDGSNWLEASQKAHKKIEKWVRKSPSSPKAKAWIANKDRMRNEPKGGIREEDSHYLPGYTSGFYGYDPETSRSKIQDLHHDIRRCSSINDACNTVAEKWKSKLAEMSKLNATHLDDLDDDDIEKLLPIAIEMRKEQMSLEEGFMDRIKQLVPGAKGKPAKKLQKKSKKSKNSEQVKLSTEIDRKLRLIDDLMQKVRPLGGNLGRLMSFRKLPIDKMTPKGMYIALNDWWDSIEADLDDDSEDDNDRYAQSAEKLYDLWEEVGFKLSDYMWASGYNVKGIGQMAKIGFPAKKRTDPEWLKMNESVDEGFMDTMKQLVPGAKGKPAKGNPAKKLNAEQVKISKQIDKKLKLVDGLMQKVKPLGGQISGLMRFSRLPLEKMTPKDLYRVLNDWYDSIEGELDYGDDSVVLSKKYGRSVENLHERMEELALKIKDYMYASGYDVPHGGAKFQNKWLNKVDFSAPKRTDAKWLKMNESVELDENFIAFDYDHEVLTHFQTKADGMKWKNHKNAPDSYYLVKTKHRLLKGDMASDGSDSLSKHLDSQPFPKKDGANFSVHKESVDLDQSQLPEGFMDTMKQLVPGAKGKPQKPRKGQKTAMEMQFPYARLSVHRMIEALRKARKVERRFNAKDLSFMLDVVEEIARTRHGEQPNSGMAIHDVMNIDDVTQSYFMNKIAQNDWKKTDQAILDAMVGNGTDDYTKGGAYVKNLAHDIALSVKYAKKDAGIKESVELDEKGPKVDMKKYAAHMDRNKKKKTMSSTKKNLSDISKRADKMSRESVELDELSPKTKKSYKNKATRSIGNEKKYSDSYSDASKSDPDNPTYKSRADQHKRKLKNRMAGVKQADESTLGELSMTKSDLTKTGMKVDSKKMAELKKELMKLKKGLKVKMEEYIAESVYFEDETMEMVARDLMIMQNKILDLVEIMDDDGMGGVDSQPISLEPWVVAKITKAKDYLDSIHDYTVMDNDNDE